MILIRISPLDKLETEWAKEFLHLICCQPAQVPFLFKIEPMFTRWVDTIAAHQTEVVLEAMLVAAWKDMEHDRCRLRVAVHNVNDLGEVIHVFQNMMRKKQIKLCVD